MLAQVPRYPGRFRVLPLRALSEQPEGLLHQNRWGLSHVDVLCVCLGS